MTQVVPKGRRGWRHKTSLVFSTFVALFLAVVLWQRIVITIPPGSVGVLWLTLFGGTVKDFYFTEGLKIIFPWDRIYIYDTRLKRIDQSVTAMTKDGLPVTMAIAVTYSVTPQYVSDLHQSVGPNYEETLIDPVITAEVTRVITSHRAEGLYTLERMKVEGDVLDGIRGRLKMLDLNGADGLALTTIADLSIRRITLPEAVQAAIEAKQSAEQGVIEQRLLSQRREIEAEGVRRFQEIVTPGITESYLRWQGIEATLRLAQSPNSKVVVIGGGPGGLPLILDGLRDQPHSPDQAEARK